MNRQRIGIAVAALIASGTAMAAGSMTNEQGMSSQEVTRFQQLDANRDGRISPQEARIYSPLSKDWNQVDTNGDGTVDNSEFSAFEQMEEQRPNQYYNETGIVYDQILGRPPHGNTNFDSLP